jgi:ubiquinone/menaquinone biosynthesis C-methylase UbiE
MSETGGQRAVDEHFDRRSDYWREVYAGEGAQSLVYRKRMETALAWVDRLNVPPGGTALDVGCGAGLMAVELATRGMQVAAYDSSPEMVRQAQQTVETWGLPGLVKVARADAHELPLASASARLIVALGLIPWLPEPQRAVNEMARVLEPGGWLILTADNALRLNVLTDPSENPLFAPLRPVYRAVERWRRHGATGSAPYHRHRPAQVRRMLLAAGLQPTLETSVGFGPFTFMGRHILSDERSIALNRRLEGWAEGHSGLRRHGWHFLVSAQRVGGSSG